MAKYYNFGELKIGDYIFSTEFENKQSIKQNCVGSIYNRYIITDIQVKEDELLLEIVYDKSTFIKGWEMKGSGDNSDRLTVRVKPLLCSHRAERTYYHNGNGYMETKTVLYATNIESLDNEIETVINEMRSEVDSLKKSYDKLNGVLYNINMNYQIRKGNGQEYTEINKKPEYKEVVITEEVIV